MMEHPGLVFSLHPSIADTNKRVVVTHTLESASGDTTAAFALHTIKRNQ